MPRHFLALLVFEVGCASVLAQDALEPVPALHGPALAQDAVPLAPFEIDAASAPAVVKLTFRHHLMWSGVNTLTFASVPASWAKTGIRVNDHITGIDGHRLEGMRVFSEFGPLLRKTFGPLNLENPRPVHVTFSILSGVQGVERDIAVVVTKKNTFTIYTNGF